MKALDQFQLICTLLAVASLTSCSQYQTVGQYETDDVYFATNDYLVQPTYTPYGDNMVEEDYFDESRYDSLDARYDEIVGPQANNLSALDQGCGLYGMQSAMGYYGYNPYNNFGYYNPYQSYFGLGFGYSPFGQSPYGFNPYGYNPYGYNPYGYNMGYGSYMGYSPYYPTNFSPYQPIWGSGGSTSNASLNPGTVYPGEYQTRSGNVPNRGDYINHLRERNALKDGSGKRGYNGSTRPNRPDNTRDVERPSRIVNESIQTRQSSPRQNTRNTGLNSNIERPVSRSNSSPRTRTPVKIERPSYIQSSPSGSSSSPTRSRTESPVRGSGGSGISIPSSGSSRPSSTSPRSSGGGSSPAIRRR